MTDLDLYYKYKTEKGLAQRGLADKQEYVDRLNHENNIILKMGFPGYFLITQDFINWCKSNNIYVGPGRGSAAGSLACYSLGITNLDPIKYDLLFERFLNPDRISMPDIDVDFEKRYRDRVIEYVTDRFGKDHVAHIGTFGKLRAKAAIKAVAKTLGHPYELGNDLSKLVLAPISGKPQPLKDSLQKVPELSTYMNHKTSTQHDVLSWALKLEGSIANVGVHASGIVISNTPLNQVTPLFKGRGDEITTQWEMENIEEIGLIKFDFLGLKALEIIHQAIDLIKESKGINIDIDSIPLDDEQTYADLRAGENANRFQLEGSSGIRDLLVQIRPKELEDIIAIVAIYRPGPLQSNYKDIYLGVRAGIRNPEYIVPELEPYLGKTAGWLIYQEQIIQIAKGLCGYTGGEADELRKAVGKKKQKLMEKHEPKFKKGWADNGLPEDKVDELWENMVAFAQYGFNKSHAAAYALITYQTSYLMTHFPTEFMCSVMISEAKNKDDIIQCLTECKRKGIDVAPPDINKSSNSFSLDDKDTIRFGLGPIKNIGKSVQGIIEEREKNGNFNGLLDFCSRVDLSIINRGKLESLVRAGAFDRFGKTRASLLVAIDEVWEYKKLRKAYENKLVTWKRKGIEYQKRLEDIEDGILSTKGRPLKPLKDPEKPEAPTLPQINDVEELKQDEIQKYEHELLGFYISSHPLDGIMEGDLAYIFNTIEDAKSLPAKTHINTGVVVTKISEITTRVKKKKMCFLSLEDLTGSIEAVCFPSIYERCKPLLEEGVPLKVNGVVEVTENDDGRVTKIIIKKISLLNIDSDISSRQINSTVKISRSKELVKIIDRYSGKKHRIKMTLEAEDGTQFKLPNMKIGSFQGSFMRELSRIIND